MEWERDHGRSWAPLGFHGRRELSEMNTYQRRSGNLASSPTFHEAMVMLLDPSSPSSVLHRKRWNSFCPSHDLTPSPSFLRHYFHRSPGRLFGRSLNLQRKCHVGSQVGKVGFHRVVAPGASRWGYDNRWDTWGFRRHWEKSGSITWRNCWRCQCKKQRPTLNPIFDVFKPNKFSRGRLSPRESKVLGTWERGKVSPYVRQPSPPTASAGTTRGLLSTMTFWNVLSLAQSQWHAQPAASGTDFTGRASQARMPSLPGTASEKDASGPGPSDRPSATGRGRLRICSFQLLRTAGSSGLFGLTAVVAIESLSQQVQ